MVHRIVAWVVVAASVVSAGCGTRRITDTPRTASEQLLVAAAVDRAIGQLDFTPLADRKVFFDTSLVERVDQSFIKSSVRARAWSEGVQVVDSADGADYVAEIRSGAVGVDRSEYILGIPAAALPTPGGTVPIPEAAIYKSIKQTGASRISMIVYRPDDRRLLYASGPTYGFSDQRNWWLAGAGPVVKENIKPPRDAENTAAAPDPIGPRGPDQTAPPAGAP